MKIKSFFDEKITKVLGCSLLIVGGLYGCKGGSSDDSKPSMEIKKGVFIDSRVSGINYRTDSQKGVTNTAGEFDYLAGESVVFYMGDLEFPAVVATEIVTPEDIAKGDATLQTNMLQILQSLDSDANPENGISIHDEADAKFSGVSFDLTSEDFDSLVMSVLEDIGGGLTLVSEADANAHFEAATSFYSQSDLTGQWNLILTSTPSNEATEFELANNFSIGAGGMLVDENGTYTLNIDGEESGRITISKLGVITDSEDSEYLGQYLNTQGDMISLVFNDTSDHEQGLLVFVKTADVYSQADLTGTWNSIGIITPTNDASDQERINNYYAEAGTMVIDDAGAYQFTTNDDSDTGNLSINNSGEITESGEKDHLGFYMNASKDTMVLSFESTTDHEQGSIIFLKSADTYSQQDLTGIWDSVGTITPAQGATAMELSNNYYAEAGVLTIDNEGAYQFTTTDDSDTGNLSISNTGVVTDAGGDDHLGFYMNASKNIMTLVFNNTEHHEQGSIIFTKRK